MRTTLSIIAGLLLAASLFGAYPDNTTPANSDPEALTAKKINRLLDDAKTGAAPLTTSATVTGGTVTPVIANVSTSGSVAAGKKAIIFVFSSNFTGTVLGATFAGATDYSLQIPIPEGSTTSGTVAYTVTAGSINILSE